MYINYDKIQPLDYVNTTSASLLAWGIRLRTCGFSNQFDLTLPTHSGMIVNIPNSQGSPRYFIAEMLAGKNGGLKINPLKKYFDNGKYGARIVSIRRNPVYDSEAVRFAANDRIVDWYNITINYDVPGVIKYIWPEAKDRPGKYYCSELIQKFAIMDANPIRYRNSKGDDIPPVGIHRGTNLLKVEGWDA